MAVTRDEIDRLCAALPGAVEAHPPELVSWKVGGKMFACFGGDGTRDGVSVKCRDTATAAMLIEAGAAVRAPYFHASWLRLIYADISAEDARYRIITSYDLVRTSLPKAIRATLASREGF